MPEPKAYEYEDLVEILAQHVYDAWYRPLHSDTDENARRYFDDWSSSGPQITAAVLTKLKIMTCVRPSIYRFTCEPSEFKSLAIENRHLGHGYDVVVLAMIGMVDYSFSGNVLEDCLFDLGLYAAGPRDEILHTEKMVRYERLYDNWANLIK